MVVKLLAEKGGAYPQEMSKLLLDSGNFKLKKLPRAPDIFTSYCFSQGNLFKKSGLFTF